MNIKNKKNMIKIIFMIIISIKCLSNNKYNESKEKERQNKEIMIMQNFIFFSENNLLINKRRFG